MDDEHVDTTASNYLTISQGKQFSLHVRELVQNQIKVYVFMFLRQMEE